MLKEQKYFDDALRFLQDNYNTNWEELPEKLAAEVTKYKSPLYGKLLLVVVEHLENKARYEGDK